MKKTKSLKHIIKDEYVKCAQDPVYFMKKYCQIQHPTRGRIPFNLYKFQERSLEQFQHHEYNIILKSRQLGISTISAGYSLWMMLFQQDKNVLVIATKQEVAKNLVTKVREMHNYLPSWLKGTTVEDNKLKIRKKYNRNRGLNPPAMNELQTVVRRYPNSMKMLIDPSYGELESDAWLDTVGYGVHFLNFPLQIEPSGFRLLNECEQHLRLIHYFLLPPVL